MKQIKHKQGDTLLLTCTWTDPNGLVVDLTNYTITSKVKVVAGTLFEDTLTTDITSPASGIFILSATATDTALWPVTSGQYGRMFCDVQFSKDSVVVSTETFEIVVLLDITT